MILGIESILCLLDDYRAIKHLRVAYSGGVDSHVLLHILAVNRKRLAERTLSAVYVDHGLHAASGAWGEHCQTVCRQLGLMCERVAVEARPVPGESPEAAARNARYRELGALLGADDALLTAHHCDDQAETLLLQLLRGAGPRGLAAMPAVAALGRGKLLRPLLSVERNEILAYARRHDLVWVEDTSNFDTALDRNYLRHEILPRLQRRWPAASRSLTRAAGLCAETVVLTDVLAADDWRRVRRPRPDCLGVSELRALERPRQRNVLRYWLRLLGLPMPSKAQLCHVLDDVVAARHDSGPCVRWPGCELRRYRDSLYAMPPLAPHDPNRIWNWSGAAPFLLPGVGRLSLQPAQGEGLAAAVLSGHELQVRFRRGGERFQPNGRRHSQSLKKLLQELGLPPWERSRLPLLYLDDRLVAVAGLGVAAGSSARAGENGWILEWQNSTPSDTV